MTATPERSPHVFTPTREHILAIVIATGIALMGILWAPKYLAWLLIFPALWLAWVLASSTTVSERGITAKYLFRKTSPYRGGICRGSRSRARPSMPSRQTERTTRCRA